MAALLPSRAVTSPRRLLPISLAIAALPACGSDGAASGDASTSAGETPSSTSDGGTASAPPVTGSSGDGDATSAAPVTTGDAAPTTAADTTTADATVDTTAADATTADTTTADTTTASDPDTAAETGDPLASRCTQTPDAITCEKQTIKLGPDPRDVHFQVPLGEPPPAGWPAVLMFQGSLFSAEITWSGAIALPFGAYYQTLVVKTLLDHGYAVITPETKLDGGTFWDTNVPPYANAWETSDDHALMLALFAAIADETFGPIDPGRLFATGISSGGYMTSRMAVSYPGKFRTLAIAAGSYATCSGPLCDVPVQPPDHPPTLFVHGEQDLTVPLVTAVAYRDALATAGVDTKLVTDPDEGHAWIPAAPLEILQWFDDHP